MYEADLRCTEKKALWTDETVLKKNEEQIDKNVIIVVSKIQRK